MIPLMLIDLLILGECRKESGAVIKDWLELAYFRVRHHLESQRYVTGDSIYREVGPRLCIQRAGALSCNSHSKKKKARKAFSFLL